MATNRLAMSLLKPTSYSSLGQGVHKPLEKIPMGSPRLESVCQSYNDTRRIPTLTGRNKCFWYPKLKYETHFVMETVLQKQAVCSIVLLKLNYIIAWLFVTIIWNNVFVFNVLCVYQYLELNFRVKLRQKVVFMKMMPKGKLPKLNILSSKC